MSGFAGALRDLRWLLEEKLFPSLGRMQVTVIELDSLSSDDPPITKPGMGMKVFISWSGERSREVANLLREWISCVLQATKPWVSTRDIDRGSLWFGEISGQLHESTVGIICLTQSNREQPWILFEAGALAKGLTTQRVCTLLVDLTPADVRDPLAQFNHTVPTKESIFGLVATLNGALGPDGLESKVLEQVFSTYWPQFESSFATIIETTEAPPPVKKDKGEVLGDVLDLMRGLSNRMARIEQSVLTESARPIMENPYRTSTTGRVVWRKDTDWETVVKRMRASGASTQEIFDAVSNEVPPSRLRRILREDGVEPAKD